MSEVAICGLLVGALLFFLATGLWVPMALLAMGWCWICKRLSRCRRAMLPSGQRADSARRRPAREFRGMEPQRTQRAQRG